MPQGQSENEPHKRGLNTKIHLAVDALGLPIRFSITEGTRADCMEACSLPDGFEADYLLAGKGYDSAKIINRAEKTGARQD